MDRMKTFLKYILAIVIFFFFSNFLIYMNLETTYQNIGRKDTLEQVTIYQAQATKVNGRIKGTIYNDVNHKINDRYLKIDLYSENGNLLGTKYVDLLGIRENETRELELYFKVQDVEYYEMSFTEERAEQGELPEMLKDLTKEDVLWGTFLTFLIFW